MNLLRVLTPVFCVLFIGIRLGAAVVSVPAEDRQPVFSQLQRLAEALQIAGAPLSAAQADALQAAGRQTDPALAFAQAQAVFESRVLFEVTINPESRVKVANGPATPELSQSGWVTYLVKVHNQSGTTARLRAQSPQAERLFNSPAENVSDRWLALDMPSPAPLKPELGGLVLEYRLIQLYSRDSGRREARIGFDAGQGTQDLGFRGEASVLFQCRKAETVRLSVKDENGKPTTGALWIRDAMGHSVPAPAKRLAPDFFFHPQVYREDGETLVLPPGDYSVEFSRGPESIAEIRKASVTAGGANHWEFKVRRWIDPSLMGWWSGDHHIHAAGCAHYTKPTEGVHAGDMMRHVLGEDLKVGANLTWGPCFDYQKQFFTGKDDVVSRMPYILHYDVEVSGFGSHQSGHLCLLRLREQMYPGGNSMHHWPTLGLNTLKWAKKQGALCGPAHSGNGLYTESAVLPNFEIPPFNGIGANEYIVDVTHELPGPDGKLQPAVDFISTIDTAYTSELNIWYHTLNAGYRTRISGETDFPCVYGERVGLGRSYVKLDGALDYMAWCEGVRAGRNYVSDGWSHLIDFRVDDSRMGEGGSELRMASPRSVRVGLKVAAMMPEKTDGSIRRKKIHEMPYWHLERARIENTREVPVEILVNGRAVATKRIVADGTLRDLEFQIPISQSCWVAARILPASHTNPVWVMVGGKPVRASRKSVQWCLDSVERCWQTKEKTYKGAEHGEAVAAYEHARAAYRSRLQECETE